MLTPKTAVMVCTNRSGFFASENAIAEPQQRHQRVHDQFAAASDRGNRGNERDHDRADTATFITTTMRKQGRRRRQCLRSATQQYDVDETAEQCAEIHKHNARAIVHVTRRTAPLMIDTADALTAFAASAARAPALALDTEFMREKTYRAELCLLQIADGGNAACIDPLAIPDLVGVSRRCSAPPGVVKIMHAARQDLEVLFPAVGLVRPVFDTQIAAALAGHPAQVGYAELARRLLGVELAKAHTRADWSRRPLSAEEQEYALDDVRHLAALRASLLETLAAKGRLAWLEEELAALANPDALRVAPEDAWRKVKGLPALDPARQQLAQALAAWRERRADRTQSAARLDSRRRDACAKSWCACRARSKRSRRCRKCRSRWFASAARNCWRWCATPASAIRRRPAAP